MRDNPLMRWVTVWGAVWLGAGCANTPAPLSTQTLPIRATSNSTWQNFAMPSMTGAFTLEYDAVPSANDINGLVSISQGPASTSDNGATLVRFNTSGVIDALNGGAFGAEETIAYVGGTSCHFRISVDVAARTFNAVVTPDGDVDRILAANAAFATAQATVTSLDDIGLQSLVGSIALSNVRLTIPVSTQPGTPGPDAGGGQDAGMTVPAAASNLAAQSASATSVQLQWQDNSANESGFLIQRRATHGTAGFAQVGSVAANVTQFLDTGLTTGWQYDYQVLAFNSAGNAPPSNTVTIQVLGSGGGGTPVNCNNNSGDAAAIQTAINAGGTISLSGTCALGSTSLNMGSGVTLQGTATLNYSGGGYALYSSGNNNAVTGLTFVGGGIDLNLSDTTTWTGQYGWTITHNTFQNITNGNDGVHVENILGKGAASTISNNTFTNIWQGGYPAFPASCASNPVECVGGSGIFWHMGLDNTTIDSNSFDQIGYNAIKGFWDGFEGKTLPFTGHNVTFSNNIMTNVHRIGMEFQGAGQGNCPGGCDYSHIPTDGTVVKGNYYHSPALQYDNFGLSVMIGGTNVLVINNTILDENPTCYWPVGIALENSMSGGTLQGNVMGSVLQSCAGNYNNNHGWAAYIDTGYASAGYTDTFQNNVACGENAVDVSYDPYFSATAVIQFDFVANGCPAAGSLTSSNIALDFTSPAGQAFPNGGSGTWRAAVVSNLSIRQVEFFVDGASTPAASQEIQDVSSTFAADRAWLYHATFDTTGLAAGSHMLTAVATDVGGNTQSVSQTFSR